MFSSLVLKLTHTNINLGYVPEHRRWLQRPSSQWCFHLRLQRTVEKVVATVMGEIMWIRWLKTDDRVHLRAMCTKSMLAQTSTSINEIWTE